METSCKTCRYGSVTCPVLPCASCNKENGNLTEYEPFTYGDHIRTLDDETLAKWLVKQFCNETGAIQYRAIRNFIMSPYMGDVEPMD